MAKIEGDRTSSPAAAHLRRRAEELLATAPSNVPNLPTSDVQRLVRELQVHQAELEVQNEELRQAQVELAHSRDRFSDLYDFAPIGYLTLAPKGTIVEANLTAASMLGVDRRNLLDQPITKFVAFQSQDDFYLHCQTVFRSDTKHVCELEMQQADHTPLAVRLESIAFGTQQDRKCRTAVIDITQRRTAERTLQEFNETLESRVAEQTRQIRLLAKAVANLGEGVMITENDVDWPAPQIVFVNQAMCRISGYTQQELIGQSPRILQGPGTDLTLVQRMRSELAGGRSSQAELIHYHKDGTAYDTEVLVTPLVDSQAGRTHFVAIHRDITDRKQAERSLEQRENWMKAILHTASDAIFTIDRRGTITGINPATERMFGYAEEEMIGQSLGMLLPPPDKLTGGDREQHDENLTGYFAFEAEQSTDTGYEMQACGKDGTIFPVEMAMNKIDHLPLFACVIRDITERKSAEQALRESQQRFELAIRGSSEGIWDWTDVNQELMWWSPRLYYLLGYEPGEIPANLATVKERIHPDDIDAALGAVQAHFATNIRFDTEFRMRTKSGKYRWFRSRAAVLRDDNGVPQRMSGCLEDIDQRKRVEESFRREHELTQNIIDTAPTIVLVLNFRGRIVRFNRFLEQLTQWKSEEVRGKNWFELFINEDQRRAARKRFETALAGERTRGDVSTIRTRDGGECEIEWHDAPLTNDRGALVGLLCTGQDISDRRLLEREILEISADEQRRIGSDLHDGVCQELTGLGLLAQGLADELDQQKQLSAVDPQRLANLQQTAQQLSEGIGQATQHSRALAHGLIPVDVDAQGLLAALKELVSSISGLHAVHCTLDHNTLVELDDNLIATHLYRIAQEAAANALRHSRARHIRVALHREADQVVLCVTDDGVGLPKSQQHSDGMGMRIMKYRANLIHATLLVESQPGEGTVVQCRCVEGSRQHHHSSRQGQRSWQTHH